MQEPDSNAAAGKAAAVAVPPISNYYPDLCLLGVVSAEPEDFPCAAANSHLPVLTQDGQPSPKP